MTGVGHLCASCFDEWAADRLGVVHDSTPLAPVTVTGPDGREHTFEILSRLGPTGRVLTAAETTADGSEGYEFRVMGDNEADSFELMGELQKRIRAGVEQTWVEPWEHGGWKLREKDRVRGRLTWDEDNPGQPLVVIDGRPFTWEDFGRMLSTFEGFLFDIRIEDSIDVVGGPLAEGRRRR
ncbi:MAG: hypothetical protein KJ067_18610 [Vicinamibacteria bacterium]|nr:hypothetical protein [Vicinamibacteria bacterium]